MTFSHQNQELLGNCNFNSITDVMFIMKYTARYTSFVTMILKLHCNLSRMESIDNGVSLKLNKSMPIKNGVVKSWSSLLITETSFDGFNPTSFLSPMP